MANHKIGALSIDFSVETENALKGLRGVQAELKTFQSTIRPATQLLTDMGTSLMSVGKILTVGITAPIAAISAVSIKAAADFESSFAGVRKTVDATEAEFKSLSDGIRGMSKELPVSANELNRIAEAAGQLGIRKEDILGFTKQMAFLGETTNLTSDEAATATAQIQNIFSAAGKDTDRFAATLVGLGNAGASTERDIIDMGLRIAGAGKQIGLTQDQVLSFASALSSVGIEADAGGSSISRVFLKINDAVMSGGRQLESFAAVAGKTSAEFKQSFETDAAAATVSFISGLGKIGEQGGNVSAVIERLIGKNIQIKDTLLRASGAGELLADQLKIGAKAWAENTAAINEAEQRHKTFDSQLQLVKNQFNDVAITLGTSMLPILKDFLVAATPVIKIIASAAEAFSELPAPVQNTAFALAAMAATLGPVAYVGGSVLTWAVSMQPVALRLAAAFGSGGGLAGVIPSVTGALSALSIGSVAAVAGTVALGAAIGVVIGKFINWAIEGTRVRDVLDSILPVIAKGIPILGNWAHATDATVAAAKLSESAQSKLAEALTKQGIAFDKSRLGNSEYVASLGKGLVATGQSAVAHVQLGAATESAFAASERLRASQDAAAATAKQHKSAVDSLIQSVVPAAEDVSVLSAAIRSLNQAGIPAAAILDGLGKKAEEMGRLQVAAGKTVDAAVGKLWLEYETRKVIAAAEANLIENQEANRKAASGLYEELTDHTLENDLAASRGKYNSEVQYGELTIDNAEKVATETFDRMKATQKRIEHSHAEIAKDAAKESEKWQRVWENAMGDVVSRFSKGVTDMIFSGKGFADSVKGIFKDLAKTIVETLVTDAFTKVAKGISGLVLGGEGGGFGLADIGKGIKGLFGGGGKNSVADSAGTLAGAATSGVGIASSAAGGASSAIGGISGFAKNLSVVGAVTGIANDVVSIWSNTIGKIGDGRKAANEIVKSQTVFDEQKARILTDPTAGVTSKLDQIESLWADFQKNLASFAQGGETNAKVANQAFATESADIAIRRSDLIAAGAQAGGSSGSSSLTIQDGAFRMEFNIDGGNPDQIVPIIQKNVEGVIAPALLRMLGFNTGGFAANWIREEDRQRLGVAGA